MVAVEVTPALSGRPVALSRLVGKSWRTVATTVLTDRGLAEFSVPTYDGRGPITYRATASAFNGLQAVTTAQVASTKWGSPDFVDEFSGTALGPSWSHRGGAYNPDGLRRCSKGSPEAVRVADGAVRLSVIADPARLTEPCPAYRKDGSLIGQFTYRLNGHISTQAVADLTYGVAAARMKFQQARGQHGAFWLQPTSPAPGATSADTGGAEIDVIEWFGEGGANGGLSGSVYHPTASGQAKEGGWITTPEQYLSGPNDAWWGGYHVFSVEWTPVEYVFRVDGRETWRTSAGVSRVPEYPILSLLSSDYELPNLGGEDRLPQHLYVDWVQFWRS